MQFIQRKVYFDLKEHLTKPEISLILGPRQAGKTTIMKRLASNLEEKGQKTVYFNLDVIEDRQYFRSQNFLWEKIKSSLGVKKGVVFIDEIQRLTNAGLFLKGLYDLSTGIKFIVSGSGSLELKENIIEPMTGRKRIFYCLPISFTEYATYKLATTFREVSKLLLLNLMETERIVTEYLFWGGYPRVVLADTQDAKWEILKEIFQSYLEKDIQLMLGVEKEASFSDLVKILSGQVGNLLNRKELSRTLGVAEKTIEKYLYFLEKTFVTKRVKPFYRNPRKEITKAPKIYFQDLGFLTLARGVKPDLKQIDGGRFENACLLRLTEIPALDEPFFWRSSSGAEVDFVLNAGSEKIVPFEVKLTAEAGFTLGKSLYSFAEKYKTKEIFIWNLKRKEEEVKRKLTVNYLPFHELPDLTGLF